MKDALLRTQKDRLLRPVVERHFGSVSPMTISLVALVPGIGAALAVANGLYGVGLALWLLNRLIDGIDGLVARVHGKKSDLGGYVDLLSDFVAYMFIPIGFALANPTPLMFWGVIALFTSYQFNTLSWTLLSAILEKERKGDANRLTSVEMPAGLIEGAETVVIYALFLLLPLFAPWLFFLMAALVMITAGQRVMWAAGNLGRRA
jgi:phosphatidylglycerophosphate synthase